MQVVFINRQKSQMVSNLLTVCVEVGASRLVRTEIIWHNLGYVANVPEAINDHEDVAFFCMMVLYS